MSGFPVIKIGVGALLVAAVARAALPLHEGGELSFFVGPAQAADTPKDAVAAETGTECETPEILLQAIRDERALLEGQKQGLADRTAELQLLEERLKTESDRLDGLRGSLADLLERAEAAQTADVDRLVALYRNMKPAAAALIMDDLDLETSILVIGTMPERDAAPILARLSPIRARAISKIILERSQLPGDQDLGNIRID